MAGGLRTTPAVKVPGGLTPPWEADVKDPPGWYVAFVTLKDRWELWDA